MKELFFTAFLLPTALFVVLPVAITWLYYRKAKYIIERRTQIVLAAIEKNPNLDVHQFMQALLPPQRPLRERLINRIHTLQFVGWTLTILGATAAISFLAFGIYSICVNMLRDGFFVAFMCSLPVFSLGIGALRACKHDKAALAQLQTTQD